MTLASSLTATTALFVAHQLPSANLDAQLLHAHVLHLNRTQLISQGDRHLGESEMAQIQQLTQRRLLHEPMAYILKQRSFYQHDFYVDHAVLIPRPETEILVEQALQYIQAQQGIVTAVDVGTGSGAIAISLVAASPQVQMLAIDKSAAALAVADKNAKTILNSEQQARWTLVRGDLFTDLPQFGPWQLMVSNPPYIPTRVVPTLEADVAKYEPHLALDGGEDGLKHLLALIALAKEMLHPGGCLLLECGFGQAPILLAQAKKQLGDHAMIINDLAGIGRCIRAIKD